MKLKCNYSQGNQCTKCKHETYCTLLEPTNKNHSILQREINYWLNELKKAKRRLIEYETILNEIKDHKYTIPVNVYGHIEYAPQTNAVGVFIRKPEHVVYGWNYGRLLLEVDHLTDKVRLLNRKELNMRRILERRCSV